MRWINSILFFFLAGTLWTIEIEGNGGHTTDKFYPLQIKGATTQLLQVVWNGIPFQMKSYDSYRILNLRRGWNIMTVRETVKSGEIPGFDSRQIFADVSPVYLKVIHTWDTGDNYVDIFIKEPSGEVCNYGHRSTALGGEMDIGSDTVGYGPQIYTMAFPAPGVYEFYVTYYEGSSSGITEVKTFIILYEGTVREERKVFEAMLTGPGERVFLGKIEMR